VGLTSGKTLTATWGGGQYARARDAAVGGRERVFCGRPGVCAVWAVGGCGGVAVVRAPWGAVKGGGFCSAHYVAAGAAIWRPGAGPSPGFVSCARTSAPIQVFYQCRCDRAARPTGPQARLATLHRTIDTSHTSTIWALGPRWHPAVQFREVPNSIRGWLSERKHDIADPQILSWWTETDLRTDFFHQSDTPMGLTWCS